MNRDAVFGDEADAELRALLRIADMRTDMEARHAAGWLCVARAAGDLGDHGRVHVGMAGALLFPVWVADPRLVPPQLAVGFARIDPALRPAPTNADGPAEWAGECAALVIAAEGQQHNPPPDASEDTLRLYESAARYGAMTPSRETQLATAIACGSLAVLATPDDDPESAARLEGLSYAVALAGMTWPFGDLSIARVRLGHRVLKSIPSDSPDRLLALSDLGIQLLERYRRAYDPEDLHEAVGIARDVLAQLPRESPHLPHCLSALGSALMMLREQEDSTPEECDEVVDLFRRAAPDDPKGPAVAGLNLGLALVLRTQRTGRVSDLHEAVHVLTEALRVSRDPEQSAAVRRALGNAQRARFTQIGGDPAELETAITHLSDTAGASSELTPHTAPQLLAPAMARYARYERNPEANGTDLAEALRLLRQAVALLPPGHPLRPEALHHLGQVLKNSYERAGNPEEASEAVRAQREAVALTPEGHTMFETRLLDLGMALSVRHLLTDDGEDLREAQDCWRRAVPSPGLDRAAHATLLGKAGIIRSMAISRTPESVAQLDETVRLFREALARTPEGHPLLPNRRLGLAAALMVRGTHTQRLGDAREARKLADMVIAVLPANSPNLPNALGVAAGARFLLGSRNLWSSATRDEAVTLLRQQIEVTPPSHPRRALRLANLGHALVVRRAGRHRADLVKAAGVFQEGALQQHCAPSQRLEAARFWGDVQAELGDWAGALEGYAMAVDLLHSVAPRHLVRDDQEFLLSRAVGLGAAAAACAVRCGRPGLAVGLLEQARGVLLSHAFDADSDLTRLREAAPDLADRFEELRDALDTATDGQDQGFLEEGIPGAAHGPDARADLRQRLAAQWRELTGRIRAEHPELGLLRPVLEWNERELRATAAAGPVVLVNVSPYGSDALIVTERSIDAVPLPGLDPRTTVARRQALQDALLRIEMPGTSRTESLRAQRVVRDTLAWLWQSVTGPVLGHLGITAAPAGPLPRVWWAPGGVLGTLPLHAATPEEGAPGALDRVISSYTPTLRALHHARQRAARPAGTGALVVAVGDAAGLAPLPAARREAEHLARLLPGPEMLTGASATHSAVVAALPQHAYAHFACHALGDLERPSASRLVLHDHTERPLTVRDLARLRLPSVRLAYLSACDTMRTSPELADEAVHIVSALQIAGFPHVVGSLWHVDDTIGAGVAQNVYEALGTGDGALDVDRTAEALHSTVCALRDTYPQTPSLWACQVHAGP
ncbi:CHAT domain-containing protein [Streptomyces sp. NBC_00365]|uniref:CHAT domain-containing tetratricopeptide repeat protein n=1 Tax=Streptomyces sp. NBC_00365 TaxID=2975726 RepID=UPI00224D9CE3|nr:CHAT domain-containing protein [Streptomyces sp. NBC_00365]MCX5097226.1 CHAT domain-containing protein [Streptomyces sp. NBC_00365]